MILQSCSLQAGTHVVKNTQQEHFGCLQCGFTTLSAYANWYCTGTREQDCVGRPVRPALLKWLKTALPCVSVSVALSALLVIESVSAFTNLHVSSSYFAQNVFIFINEAFSLKENQNKRLTVMNSVLIAVHDSSFMVLLWETDLCEMFGDIADWLCVHFVTI